ncbi:MAG: (d)CMP kinase [Rickettsiaceae bacterium]|jgi:cytidylate kinase|nr:(d)CMP kinase [Rickettsiaceae bacterium]
MNPKKLLIAIDGPSSSGKGTIAKKIATHFNLPCLNTGALYRAIAFLALEQGLDLEDVQNIIPLCGDILKLDLESPKLHNEEIGKAASIVAARPEIRKAIFDLQRDFALIGIKEKAGAVLEGRDIGTVICPDANHKFFITASAEVRATRRVSQLKGNNVDADYNVILEQLKNRDFQDKTRAVSPLKKADDAIEIDTSEMNIEQVFQKILSFIK